MFLFVPAASTQLNQQSIVKLPVPRVKSAWSGVLTESPTPSHRSEAPPHFVIAVSSCAFPLAVHVWAEPPALLSVIVVEPSVPLNCRNAFTKESLIVGTNPLLQRAVLLRRKSSIDPFHVSIVTSPEAPTANLFAELLTVPVMVRSPDS